MGIIICADCSCEVPNKTKRTKRCKGCAKKRHMKQIISYKAESLKTNPEALRKDIARRRANYALIRGHIIRPERCELCNQIPSPLKNGRSGLRMDHYNGYDEEYWFAIRFVCIPCDAQQIKERNRSVSNWPANKTILFI